MMSFILSEESEILLQALLEGLQPDGWVISKNIPDKVSDKRSARNELEEYGMIEKSDFVGRSKIQCIVTRKGKDYFNNKPKLEVMEAMQMFVPLPPDLKSNLKQITTTYKDGDYIQNNIEMVTIIDELKKAGYLRKFKRYHNYSYYVKFSYEDLHYDSLEQHHNQQAQSVNNFTFYGGNNQVNTANDHGTVNATQTIGIDCDRLNKLIKETLDFAPKDNDEQLETITESLNGIKNQVLSPAPNKGIIRGLFAGLNVIASSVENCTGFVENLSKLYEFLQNSKIL